MKNLHHLLFGPVWDHLLERHLSLGADLDFVVLDQSLDVKCLVHLLALKYCTSDHMGGSTVLDDLHEYIWTNIDMCFAVRKFVGWNWANVRDVIRTFSMVDAASWIHQSIFVHPLTILAGLTDTWDFWISYHMKSCCWLN